MLAHQVAILGHKKSRCVTDIGRDSKRVEAKVEYSVAQPWK